MSDRPPPPLVLASDVPDLDGERDAQHLEFRRRRDEEAAARAQRERERAWQETEALERAIAANEGRLRAVFEHGGEAERVWAGNQLKALGVDLEHEAETERATLLDVAAIFAHLDPVKWLCQALDVASGAPALIAGYGFSGKTVAAQDLALAVASGTPLWGTFTVRPGRVLHLDYEQGSYLTRMRYQRLARARGIEPSDIDGRLEVRPFPGWYIDGDTHNELPRLCEGLDLLIVDSFRAACPLTDENSSEARIPLDRLTRISKATGVTVVVVHHSRKPNQHSQGGARMSVRGSGALFDACGSVLVFAAEKGEPIAVSHEKARISGRPHPDFRLHIEDVTIGEDPTAGLRVTHLAAPQASPTESAEAHHAALKRRIVEFMARQGPVAGTVALRARLGGRQADISAAVLELVQAGTLERGGTSRQPTLTLTGKAEAR